MTGRAKGVSIGAAMKQRMGSQGDQGIAETAPPNEEAAPVPAGIAAPSADDALESFNTRLPRSVLKRLKVHAAVHEIKIQDALRQALDEFLVSHGS